jgi:Caspase domain
LTGQRRALLMGISSYGQAQLPDLPMVDQELRDLATVFGDSKIGQFDSVRVVQDYSRLEGIEAIQDHLSHSGPQDLLLIYISGHMQMGFNDDLVILTRDSMRFPTSSGGIIGRDLIAQVSRSQVGQVILILDGCYSGIIHSLAREASNLASDRLIVIASASVGQMAWSGAFSTALVRGLEEGRADIDGDGDIKLFEAFEYVRKDLSQRHQEPTLSMFGRGAASVVIAQSVRDEPRRPTTHGLTGLPEHVLKDMYSTSVRRREGATLTLCSLYCSEDPREKSRAVLALHEMAEDPEPVIKGLARLRLSGEKEWTERLKVAARLDWSQAVYQIENLEINMASDSGDLNIIAAGHDVKGAAAGRRNRVKYKEALAASPFEDIASVQEALDALAAEIGGSDLPWKEKVEVLNALGWWQENIGSPDEPERAAENASRIRSARDWVRDRFLGIMGAMPDALTAAWVVEIINHISK